MTPFRTDVIYAMIILHCYDGGRNTSFHSLDNIKEDCTPEMIRHIVDTVNEIYIHNKLKLPKTTYSIVKTPRLIPFIYQLIGMRNIYYRADDEFIYKSVNERRSKLEEEEIIHRKNMKALNSRLITISTHHDFLVNKINNLKIARDPYSSNYDEIQDRIENFESELNEKSLLIDQLNEDISLEENAFLKNSKRLLNENDTDYVPCPTVSPVLLTTAQRTKITAYINKNVDQEIITRVLNMYTELNLAEEHITSYRIKNYQIMSNIVSFMSTKFRSVCEDIEGARNAEEFTVKNFDSSDYKAQLERFVQKVTNSRW